MQCGVGVAYEVRNFTSLEFWKYFFDIILYHLNCELVMLVQRLDSFRLKNDLNDLSGNNEKNLLKFLSEGFAEREGFEPPVPLGTTVFISGCKGTTIFWFHQIF